MLPIDSASWSKLGEKYNGPSGLPFSLPLVQASFDTLFFPHIDESIKRKGNEPLKILLLACGTGAEIEVLCNRYDENQLSILATDFAPSMVEAATDLVERKSKQDMVKTKVMDAMNIEEEASSFDIVFLILGPMLMPDPNQVFREIQRVLVRGGWSGYLTPNRIESNEIMNDVRRQFLASRNRLAEFKELHNTDIFKSWSTPSALSFRLTNARWSNVEAQLIKAQLSVKRGQELEDMIYRLFENPGLRALFTAGLSELETELYFQQVRDAIHEKFPILQFSTPATFYLTGTAACASA